MHTPPAEDSSRPSSGTTPSRSAGPGGLAGDKRSRAKPFCRCDSPLQRQRVGRQTRTSRLDDRRAAQGRRACRGVTRRPAASAVDPASAAGAGTSSGPSASRAAGISGRRYLPSDCLRPGRSNGAIGAPYRALTHNPQRERAVSRPHRALELAPPEPRHPPPTTPSPSATAIRMHDRLGGLIHEYAIAAQNHARSNKCTPHATTTVYAGP
jgi:hypothetical protein